MSPHVTPNAAPTEQFELPLPPALGPGGTAALDTVAGLTQAMPVLEVPPTIPEGLMMGRSVVDVPAPRQHATETFVAGSPTTPEATASAQVASPNAAPLPGLARTERARHKAEPNPWVRKLGKLVTAAAGVMTFSAGKSRGRHAIGEESSSRKPDLFVDAAIPLADPGVAVSPQSDGYTPASDNAKHAARSRFGDNIARHGNRETDNPDSGYGLPNGEPSYRYRAEPGVEDSLFDPISGKVAERVVDAAAATEPPRQLVARLVRQAGGPAVRGSRGGRPPEQRDDDDESDAA